MARAVNVEREQNRLNAIVRESMQRFVEVDAAKAPPMPERYRRPSQNGEAKRSLHVLPGLEISGCDLQEAVAEGDCLAPWLRDGDIEFVHAGRQAYDGDLCAFEVPRSAVSGDSVMLKVLHRRGERWLLLSRDPPLVLDPARVALVGVVVGLIRYKHPLPRSPERQAQFDRETRTARDKGYAWSSAYLSQVFEES
jgi:hypothetical protein